ncbi:MAG TPA: hypothetical protein VIL18_11655 [Longimicrobiales bacterium]
MRIRTILPMLVVSAALGCGWTSGQDLETRTFRLEHISVASAIRLIEPYVRSEHAALTSPEGGNIGAITVRETPDALDRIGAMLAEYDVPRPTVTLHFQVIEANGFQTGDPSIAEVEAALRELFRFRGYRLAAEAVVVGTEDSRVQQALGEGDRLFFIETWLLSVPRQDSSGAVQLSVELRQPQIGTLLETTVGVPLGQTMVIGTAPQLEGTGGRAASALILTVRPELTSRGAGT